MLLGLDCTHLDAGDVSFEALCCAGGEKPQEVPVAWSGEGRLAHHGFWGSSGGGPCDGFTGCLAHAIVQSWRCLLFSVSNSLFSLLP